MDPLIANTDDLVSILDRVLDKGIVMESWIPVDLQGKEQWVPMLTPASSALLFPSATVRKHIGNRVGKLSKFCSRIGGATSGANRPRIARLCKYRTVDFLVVWRYSAFTRERRAIQIYEEF